MMRKLSIKRTVGLLFLVLAIALSFVLAACNDNAVGGGIEYKLTLDKTTISLDKGESYELGYTLTKNGEADTTTEVVITVSNDNVTYDAATKKITAVKAGTALVTATVKGTNVTARLTVGIPEYEIDMGDDATVDLGDTVEVAYTVRKDGLKTTEKKVTITVTSGSEYVTFTPIGNRLTFNEVGVAKVKVALESDPSVYAEKTYTIVKSFWSSTKQANKAVMTIDETAKTVFFPGGGGQQYFLGVMDGGTKYMFKADLTLPTSLSSTHSVGLGHTLDENNSSMWFGLQHSQDGEGYRLLIKDYLRGWPGQDYRVSSYNNIKFASNTITCYTIRDGQNYWYNIGGLIGTWTSTNLDANSDTWVGIYSQENVLSISNYSYTTDEDEIAAAKAVCEADCAIFNLVNPLTAAVKGTSVTFKTQKICPDGKNPAVVWTLDKTEMTAGADGTTVENGVLTLAPDAVGKVTVNVECGGKTDSVTVDILQESLAASNDILEVDGGIELDEESGAVTFTEALNGSNPTLDEREYVDIYYAAKFKTAVKGDFRLSFKVSDLKVANGSYYMVSLGDKNGNLLFTGTSVSLYTQNVERSQVNTARELKEGVVTATFDAADEYEITVAVVGGHYEVTVNDEKVTFSADPIRNINDYTASRGVLITTKAGTSMTLTDIDLVDGADSEYIILNANTIPVKDNDDEIVGFRSEMIPQQGGAWIGKDKSVSRTYYGELLPEGDYTISMDVLFNKGMSDAKFGIQIGAWEYHVNNKIASGNVIHGQFYAGGWGDAPQKNSSITTIENAFNVTLKKISGTMYFYIGDTLIASHANAPADRILSFWTFDDGSTADGKVFVTDLEVSEGAVIIDMQGEVGVQVGTTSSAYTVSLIGAEQSDVVWSLDTEGLTAGTATFDQTAHTITMSNDAEGSVVLSATAKGATIRMTVSASSQPANQNTALAESKGGVKQDVANKTLIFDDAALNGVVNETAYTEEGGYYAILNTAANTRATIRDNFVLEFTVSDYVTTAEYPKLMISLGYKFEQFYVAYTDNGARIEAFLMDNGGNSNRGRWVNSEYFAAFDMAASHTFKLVCEDGYYKVYVDGTQATFADEIYRSVDAMAFGRNIMISTNSGTTATVSNISLTAVEGKEGKVRATYSDNFVANADGSITATFAKRSDGGRDGYHNAKDVYTYGAYIPDDCEITLSVTFNDGTGYPDEALLIRFGSDRSFGVIMNNGSAKIEQQWTWGGMGILSDKDNINNRMLGNTVKIKITVAGGYVTAVRAMEYNEDGSEKGWSNETVAMNGGSADDQKVNGFLSFGTFVWQDPSNKTVTISNIVVTPAA